MLLGHSGFQRGCVGFFCPAEMGGPSEVLWGQDFRATTTTIRWVVGNGGLVAFGAKIVLFPKN